MGTNILTEKIPFLPCGFGNGQAIYDISPKGILIRARLDHNDNETMPKRPIFTS